MAAATNEVTVLLAKKIGAMALLLFGLIAVPIGFGYGSVPLIIAGVVFLAAGAGLLALEVAHRNRE